MARKNLWTKEQLENMANEIRERKKTDIGFNAKIYAEEKGIVYGTLYQALRRNGLFEPSRKRIPKSEKLAQQTAEPQPAVAEKAEPVNQS